MKRKPHCFIVKTSDPGDLPSEGERRNYTLNYFGCSLDEIIVGSHAYVFHDDIGDIEGQLFARGNIERIDEATATIQHDGAAVVVPLTNRQLDFFVPERVDGLSEVRHQILYDISVVRRKTTQQPIHKILADCGMWLDLYHFNNPRG